jgi:hypothetical protein
MWIATIDGFYSAVQDRDDHRHVLVRMRSERDWKRAVARFWPLRMYRLTYTHDADYPWRVSVLKYAWQRYLSRAVNAITYDNFKDAIHRDNDDRAKTYMNVWSDLHGIEDEPDSGVVHEPRWRDRGYGSADWNAEGEWAYDEWADGGHGRIPADAITDEQRESLWERWVDQQPEDATVADLSEADRQTIAELLS